MKQAKSDEEIKNKKKNEWTDFNTTKCFLIS